MSKYRNIRSGGYASKREEARALQLRLEQRCGLISDLKEQVKFVLIPKSKGEREIAYIADFTYYRSGQHIVEDVKGFRTQVYRIKRRLMQHVHGITIMEV